MPRLFPLSPCHPLPPSPSYDARPLSLPRQSNSTPRCASPCSSTRTSSSSRCSSSSSGAEISLQRNGRLDRFAAPFVRKIRHGDSSRYFKIYSEKRSLLSSTLCLVSRSAYTTSSFVSAVKNENARKLLWENCSARTLKLFIASGNSYVCRNIFGHFKRTDAKETSDKNSRKGGQIFLHFNSSDSN